MYGGVSYYVFFSAQDILNSINFMLNKETPTPKGRMSVTDNLAFSVPAEMITAVNNYDYMQPKSLSTISEYKCFQKKHEPELDPPELRRRKI